MRPAMHASTAIDMQQSANLNEGHAMTDWSLLDREWPPDRPYDPYIYEINSYFPEKPLPQYCPPQAQAQLYLPPSPTMTLLLSPPLQHSPTLRAPNHNDYFIPKGENPREIRNKAEKQRRDKLNHSISELAAMVPPVVAANRKIDKTGVLRLTAHYLRAHQYVFGDSIGSTGPEFNADCTHAVLSLLKGFLLTITYKGIIVVISQNVQQYLGYTELDLFGQNIFNITHPDDRQMLKEQIMPRSQMLGSHGELLIPDEPDGKQKVAEALAKEKRKFVVRFKKLSQRSEPAQYVSCCVEGTLRKSDRACRGYNRCCQMVRRARARGDNPYSSGNDIVFIGVVRPTTETFMTESALESFKMEYRTRHSIDGEIIQCEHRIALVTGYMTHEVNGMNAMNFMHRDDVRWVIIALREMYVQHRLFGESCYRLMTKNGQFIYMKTRGQLDVEEDSRAVRSFVCTNTVVEEQEGRQLIKQMRKKFTLKVDEEPAPAAILDDETTDVTESPDNQSVTVEDPRQLKKVILNLVTNLPSPNSEDSHSVTSNRGESPTLSLAIIPPKKEQIVSAIEKIYTVIKNFRKEPTNEMQREKQDLEKIPESPQSQETKQNEWPTPPALSPTSVPAPVTRPSFINTYPQPMNLEEPATTEQGTSTQRTGVIEELPAIGSRRKKIGRRSFESTFTHPMTSAPAPLNSPSISILRTGINIGAGVVDINFNTSDGSGRINLDFSIIPPGVVPVRAPPSCTVTSTSFGCGSKRQSSREDNELPKKKLPVVETATTDETHAEQGDDDMDLVNPIFDNLFDETILGDNSQMDTTLLNSLEQESFPDLLISEEVQDILDQIEGQEDESSTETWHS